MTRFAHRGFVRVSTEISSQKVYYYNYSDIGFFGKGERLLLGQKKLN